MDKHSFQIWSPQLRNWRQLWTSICRSRTTSDACAIPSVYMQDGQNLSDPSIAFAGNTWQLERALGRVARARHRADRRRHPSRRHGTAGRVQPVRRPEPWRRPWAPLLPIPDRHGEAAHRRTVPHPAESREPCDRRLVDGRSDQPVRLLSPRRRRSARVAAMSPSIWFGGRRLLEYVEQARRRAGAHLSGCRHQRRRPRRCATRVHWCACCGAKATRPGTPCDTSEAQGHGHTETDWAARLPERPAVPAGSEGSRQIP